MSRRPGRNPVRSFAGRRGQAGTSGHRLVRVYFWSRTQQFRFFRLVSAVFTGCWLGLLSKSDLEAVDDAYYVGTGPDHSSLDYGSPEYNQRGLFGWERRAVDEFFPREGKLAVLGAGGGREVLALRQMSYRVDGWECQPAFVESANTLLRAHGLGSCVSLVPRDTVPDGPAKYDGLVIGWAAYTLMSGRARRVELLRALRTKVESGAPILLSFHGRSAGDARYRIAVTVGNLWRRLLGRERVEVGDFLDPNFVHQFIEDEVVAELWAGGFEVRAYTPGDDAYAVAVAV